MLALRSFFGGSSENVSKNPELAVYTPSMSHVEEQDNDSSATVRRNDFVSDEQPESSVITISYGTGNPIDAIYAFVTRNFEDEGYRDALINNEVSFRQSKEELLRNNLKSKFNQVRRRYKDDILRTTVSVRIAEEQMATTAAANLNAAIEIFKSHLEELDKMENDLDNGDPKMTQMIESYKRGFLKGVTAQIYSMTNTNGSK